MGGGGVRERKEKRGREKRKECWQTTGKLREEEKERRQKNKEKRRKIEIKGWKQ